VTIGKKLLWGYLVVLALLVIVTAVAMVSLARVQDTYSRIMDVNAELIEQAQTLGFEVREQVNQYRGALLYEDLRTTYLERMTDSRQSFAAALRVMNGLASLQDERAALAELTALERRLREAQDRGIALAREGKLKEAVDLGESELAPLSEELLDATDRFREGQAADALSARARIADEGRFLVLVMLLVSMLAVAAGLAIAIYLGRTISRQLQESAAQLSSSAAQILATTTQLASSATETATAVSETTTTVEEVKQTAQVASQKARQVLESAQKAAQASVSGQKTVEESIEGMHHIQSQMEAIADSIVRLSEQSQAIGEIIAVVNDLAEQSNLLAVNAAIEASRAGEQGKGFAVVAQEVRSLAEQSKQATGQVRTILGDIQKATSSAVLATEQGNKAVEAGVKQSLDAGEVINVLANGVTEAADAANQIAASSQQQMVGMDQVALAMDNIKQASAQNVAGAKQAETAAQALHELGRRLISLVGGGRS